VIGIGFIDEPHRRPNDARPNPLPLLRDARIVTDAA
jgi:hypothetical protein